ncbi:hypothetical protein Ocin01_01197 [Orchesella cincta]|uniref:Uncharacterized protein n=1 Tax=Orchesella cincta TaxID=48709 RepID=A0A1D2NK28_ORCCI|nr:hypothetical protein Ocin01_01197 [Orchesella cincta]
MGAWKRVLISSVLIVWIVSGSWANPVQNAGSVSRSAKVLEDPKVPHDAVSSENTDLQDSSERSLSVEQNMMLYRTVFTLSLKLLTVFVLVRLLTYGLTSTGILKLGGPNSPFSHAELYYPVDVHQNPAAGWTQQIQQQQPTVVAGGGDAGGVGAVDPSGGVIVTSGVIPTTVGGYDIAATNAKPSFLVPTGPRYRFGLRPWGRNPATRPRHPPMMRPHHPGMMPMIHSAQNMGEETHLVETHSHLFVHPDGTQMRVPIAGQKPVVSVSLHLVVAAMPQLLLQRLKSLNHLPLQQSHLQ